MSFLNPISWIVGAGKVLVGPVFNWLGQREEGQTTRDVAQGKVKGAVAQKLLQLEGENSKLRAQQFTLLMGWPPFRYLMLCMMGLAVWHTGEVYLDSCAHLPFPWWDEGDWLPQFMPHVVGSWHISKLPGDYASQSFKIIAMITGVQITQTGASALMQWINKR